jgi:hypothetical protein
MTESIFHVSLGSSTIVIEDWPDANGKGWRERIAERSKALAGISPSLITIDQGHIVAFYEKVEDNGGDSSSVAPAGLAYEADGCTILVGSLLFTDSWAFIAGRVLAPNGPGLDRGFVREHANLDPSLLSLVQHGGRIIVFDGAEDDCWIFVVYGTRSSASGR